MVTSSLGILTNIHLRPDPGKSFAPSSVMSIKILSTLQDWALRDNSVIHFKYFGLVHGPVSLLGNILFNRLIPLEMPGVVSAQHILITHFLG